MSRWLPGLFVLLTAYQSVAEVPLDTFAKLRALPAKKASQRLPVSVEGTVIYREPGRFNYILHDGTAGCHVHTQQPCKLEAGDRIRIEGFSNATNYSPDVTDAKVTLLGKAKRPEPRLIFGDEIFSPELDCEWVEIPATVVGGEAGRYVFTLDVKIQNEIYKADVMLEPDATQRAAELMQKKVRLRGVLYTVDNIQRQMTSRVFLVPSFDCIIPVEEKTHSEAPPLRLVTGLLRNTSSTESLVRVQGTVTQSSNDGMYLKDNSGATKVYIVDTKHYPPGTRVEVQGYAVVEPFRPTLRATKVKLLETGPVPPPIEFDPEKPLPNFHLERIVIDCKLLAFREGQNEVALQCRAGNFFFEAILPSEQVSQFHLQIGDKLRLTGICEVTTTRRMPRNIWADGFRLHLNGPEAVTITQRAPWWTFQRAMIALGVVLALFLGVAIWNGMLHRQVNAQAKIIIKQTKREAEHDERHRIAREMHDTVSQELTGLSIQLGNVSAVLKEDPEKAGEGLVLARKMLQHCHEETRASLSDLRNETLLDYGMAAILGEDLSPVVAKSRSTLDLKVEGTPRRLPTVTENHLLRIAHEAVANAARHAHAETIRVRLQYTDDDVTLEISDNGCGFDSQYPPPLGHFGILGLHERANKIGADFSLESKIGCGTLIRVYLDTRASVEKTDSCGGAEGILI